MPDWREYFGMPEKLYPVSDVEFTGVKVSQSLAKSSIFFVTSGGVPIAVSYTKGKWIDSASLESARLRHSDLAGPIGDYVHVSRVSFLGVGVGSGEKSDLLTSAFEYEDGSMVRIHCSRGLEMEIDYHPFGISAINLMVSKYSIYDDAIRTRGCFLSGDLGELDRFICQYIGRDYLVRRRAAVASALLMDDWIAERQSDDRFIENFKRLIRRQNSAWKPLGELQLNYQYVGSLDSLVDQKDLGHGALIDAIVGEVSPEVQIFLRILTRETRGAQSAW